MDMEKKEPTVTELLNIIKQASTCTASKKDETRVMKAMLNDTSYSVDVYAGTGKIGEFNPSKEMRSMCTSILSSAASIPLAEANSLMEKYTFKKSEATSMVNISKEFVNTYIHSGRKLNLGGREKSNISLSLKEVPAGERTYPQCTGTDKKGNKIYTTGKTYVKRYESIKVTAPSPEWVK